MSQDEAQMPSARLAKDPNAIVDAARLKLKVLNPEDPLTQDDVYNEKYICISVGCGAKVKPIGIGYGPRGKDKEFERGPWFALCSGEDHQPEKCDHKKRSNHSVQVDSNNPSKNDVELDEFKRISDARPLNNYPNKLSLDWLDREGIDTNASGQIENNSETSESRHSNNSSQLENDSTPKDWIVYKISPLVENFLNISAQDFFLFIPGIEVKTYGKIFQKVSFFNGYSQSKLRIYYTQIVANKIEFDNNSITFIFTDGSYVENKLKEKSRIMIDTSGWVQSEFEIFYQKIIQLQNDLKTQTSDNNFYESNFLPWLFFLGYSKTEDNSSFSLLRESWRLVELCATDKLSDTSFDSLNENLLELTEPDSLVHNDADFIPEESESFQNNPESTDVDLGQSSEPEIPFKNIPPVLIAQAPQTNRRRLIYKHFINFRRDIRQVVQVIGDATISIGSAIAELVSSLISRLF